VIQRGERKMPLGEMSTNKKKRKPRARPKENKPGAKAESGIGVKTDRDAKTLNYRKGKGDADKEIKNHKERGK